jgi:hypothetical protein
MFVYKLSLICSLLLSDALAQEGSEEVAAGTVSTDASESDANSEFTPSEGKSIIAGNRQQRGMIR